MAANDEDVAVQVTALIVLGLVLITSIVCMTVVAVMTDRNLARPEFLTFILGLCVTGLGGYSLVSIRRRNHHFRIEREELNNGDSTADR